MLQVENAIEIAFNPLSDQALRGQAIEFVNQLRTEQQGWSVCLPLALRQPRASEVVRIVALDVVNSAVQGRLETQELVYLRDNLLQHIRTVHGSGGEQDSAIIENKIAQTVTYLFTALYASHWQTFFDDLLLLTSTSGTTTRDNPNGVRFYLKVVASIHDEIADTILSRSREEQQRDNDLKDLVRDRDVQKLTTSWQEILQRYQTQNGSILEQCLSVIGRWASWTDLSLIISDQLLSLMYDLVRAGLASQDDEASKMRDVSLNAFMEILSKKMKPADKLQLIDVLKIGPIVEQLTASPPLQELRFTSNYDTDLAELVAKLVNNTINDIVLILDATDPADPVVSAANSQLKIFLPYALRFFADEYDEVCSSVIPCITDVLTLFRRKSQPDGDYGAMLPSILQAIMSKMKYDETSDWGSEDALTDEAEFSELRKRLQVLQQAVAAVDESLYIDTISNVVAAAFERFQSAKGQMDWRDLDLALHEMFLFGQLAMKNGTLYSKTRAVSPAAERLIAMMAQLVESGKSIFSFFFSQQFGNGADGEP
jgi:exportin-T